MSRLADTIILMWGWRRLALAFVAGALTALTLAPFDILPIGWITIPVLIWLIDGSAPPEGTRFLRRLLPAAIIGWGFGFGFFAAGLWWIGVSFLVDGDQFAWLLPLAVIALPAALGLFWGLGAAIARMFWCEGWPRLLIFAVVMTVMEWIRGHVFTGFPWNAFGYALTPAPVLMQSASVVGIWGLTLLAFTIFAAPVLLVRDVDRGRGRFTALTLILLLFVIDAGYGVLRLRTAEDATVPDVRLRLVQPSIPQRVKEDRSQWATSFRQQLDLSAGDGLSRVTHVIWPETALPYLLTEAPEALSAIAAMLQPGTTLITGAPRELAERDPLDGSRAIANSILVISDRGEIVDSYDKVHLVPFGEYLPLRETLEGLGIRQMISLPGGFTAGPGRRSIVVGEAPAFVPLICYEVIFPGDVMPPGDRPGWMLNVTNDAWYGNTPGPRQHLRQSIVRAVEQGLPLVRAANNGISAIVDPYGRIVASLGLNEIGVVDGDLPISLPATLYARFGDNLPAGLLFLFGIVAIVGRIGVARRAN